VIHDRTKRVNICVKKIAFFVSFAVVAKLRLHLKIIMDNNSGDSIPPTDTSMLENELEAGSSTGEPVASTVSGNAEDPANVPKSDEVGRRAELPPNESKSPILDNK
jgi:hypothetical protein